MLCAHHSLPIPARPRLSTVGSQCWEGHARGGENSARVGLDLAKSEKYGVLKNRPSGRELASKAAVSEEQLLTRLAAHWHTMRSGNPGFNWRSARAAHSSSKVYGRLQASPTWKSGASDRDIYGVWLISTASDHRTLDHFDTWDEGASNAPARTLAQKADNRKRTASKCRRASARADVLTAVQEA